MSDTWNESRKGQMTMSRRIFGTSYVDVYDDKGWTNILATHDEDSAFDEFSRQLEANGRAARLRSRSGFRTFMSVMSGLTALLCLVLFLIYATALVNGPKGIWSVAELLIWIALTALWTVFAVHLTRPVTLLCAVRTEDDEPVRTKGMEVGVHKAATGTPFPRTEGIPASAKISSSISDSEATAILSPHPLDGDGQTRSAVTQSGTSYMVMSGVSLSKLVNGLQKTVTIPTHTSTPVEAETPSETPSNVSEDDSTEDSAEKVEQPVVPSGSASLVFDDTAEHPVVTDDQVDDSIEEPETEQDEPESEQDEPEQESTEEPIDESTDDESTEDESQDELLFRKRRRVIYKGDLPKRHERLRRYIHSITQEDDGTWTVVYTDVDNIDNSDTKGELWDAIRDRVERIDGVMGK